MPKRSANRKPGPSLSFAQLRQARISYEQGQSFGAIAERFGVGETTIRQLLKSVGVAARPRGFAAATIPDLALEDVRRGLSAREVARKYNLPGRRLNAVLRELGLARAPGQRVLHPLGPKVTNMQARMRRRTPLTIAVRTSFERCSNSWTSAERRAVFHEIRAGRVTAVARGQSGLQVASVRAQIDSWFARWKAAG